MVKRRIKQGGALVLAAVLAFSTMALPKVYAAKPVDTTAQCSVEIIAGANYKELEGGTASPVTVDLYKVADIQESGAYKTVDALSNAPDFSKVSAETKAADWEEWAKQTVEAVNDAGIDPTKTGTTGSVINGLTPGLYLVNAHETNTTNFKYTFTPYLISLPNNYVHSTGNDDWVYNLTGNNAINLKPERSDRFGDLTITKTLDTYNESLGEVTFVFQIEADRMNLDTGVIERVYSNVAAITFNGPGTKSIDIQNIPSGANVTVTEIYSGASYQVTSSIEQTTVIKADKEDGSSADDVATVGFTNTFVDGRKGGYGIVNNFAYGENGGWAWNQQTDSTESTIYATYNISEPEGAPEGTTPADTTPAETTPVDTTPAETTPADTTPAETTPADTTPADTTPADTTPADTTPAETAPADTTPADTTPAETAPADTTPADNSGAE